MSKRQLKNTNIVKSYIENDYLKEMKKSSEQSHMFTKSDKTMKRNGKHFDKTQKVK